MKKGKKKMHFYKYNITSKMVFSSTRSMVFWNSICNAFIPWGNKNWHFTK